MSSVLDQRLEAHLVEELTTSGAKGTAYNRQRAWTRFAEWCEVNGLPPGPPVEEDTMLLWLFSHHGRWSWATSVKNANLLSSYATAAGHPSPFGDRTRRYLSRLRKELGTWKAQATDPVKVSDLRTMVEKAQGNDDRTTAVARAILLVAEAANLPLVGVDSPERRPREAFTISKEMVTLVKPNGEKTVVADARRNPGAFATICSALEGDEKFPLGGAKRTIDIRRKRIRKAWQRAGMEGAYPRYDLRRLDPEDFRWWVQLVDGHLPEFRDGMAFLVLGVLLARRAIDLCRLDFEDVTATSSGYRLHFRITKTDPVGKRGGLVKFVSHLASDGACGRVCPACVLRDHLELQRRIGNTSGALFRGYGTNGGRGRLTVDGAATRVRLLWEKAGLPKECTIGSRSLRVGGATSASEAGWDLATIAEELTDHASLDMTMLYVRRHDPFSHQAALRL